MAYPSSHEAQENYLFLRLRSTNPTNTCPRTKGSCKMTFLKRYLVVLFLQFGCLALDHSTRELPFEHEEDEIRLIMGHQFPGEPIKLVEDDGSEGATTESQPGDAIISFHPSFLNFKESPVGMPRLGVVRVDNRLIDENLKLISISGNSVHFHSSFFADKIIGPNGNTTFEVVFLSRMEGPVESNLYIHTSKYGMFKYHVRGFGMPNPYRLRPLVGARIPVNGNYEPLITIHNPHDKRIQVVEMLSSGTDFHLQLPDGVPEEGEGAAWAIEPFQTKSVMKGSFQGKTEGNHTGYIKIRMNSTTIASEYLLVPVEVQVSSAPGIYSPQDSLDFGLLVRSDKPKTLSLSLINAQRSPVNIHSISVKGDSSPAVRIEFRPLLIEPDAKISTVVALVTFDPSLAVSTKQTQGMIEIRSECGQSIRVPFRATVLQGELQYNTSSLGFFVKAENIPPRNFSVRNNFSAAVAIYSVSVSHPDLVQVDAFNQSQVISPGEQKAIFTMKVQKKAELCESRAEVQLTLKSNITNIQIPLTCYDGKLQLHTLEDGGVDFGIVCFEQMRGSRTYEDRGNGQRSELQSSYTEYFAVDNKNPVEVRLKSWGANSTLAQVELVGMQKGVKEDLSKIKDFDSLKKSLFVQPGHMAVFSIDVRRPPMEGAFWGESYVTTDHNQTIRVPFRFSAVSKGCIQSDMVVFDKSFPGKISFEKLHLASTFNHTLSLRRLRASPPSSMWFTPLSVQESPEILPHRKNYVGKIHFDPRKFCGSDCYSGFSTESTMGKEWVRGVSLGWDAGDIDWKIYLALQKRFEQVEKATVSLWVDTNELSGYKMKTQVTYLWPRLTSPKVVIFPLTALKNETIMEIPVANPSNSPLLVQAVLASQYGPGWSQFVSGKSIQGNVTEGNLVFSLDGVSSSSQSNGSVIFSAVQKKLVQDILGVGDSPGVSFFLPPGAKFLLKIKFQPISKEMASSVILIRNNLTGIETLWLKGRAGTGQLTVGNGVPGSSLLFQITEKLLQGCQSEQANKYVPPQLTVRRSFVARNIGEIPLDILMLEVYPPQGSLWTSFTSPVDACEGYGFRILNCHPFTILPNQTHSIDIAFTPDFTMARVVRSLRLTATVQQFNYSLVAMVPSGMLSICAAIISRPAWEPVLKYLLAVGIVIGIIAASLMAYFEAGSVVSSAVVATVRVIPAENRPDGVKNDPREVTTKLDLKSVYDKVDNRFKRNQSQSPTGIGNNKINSSSSTTASNTSFTQKQQQQQSQSEHKENNHVPSTNGSSTSSALRNRKKKGNVSSDMNLNTQMLDTSLSKSAKAHSQSNGHANGSSSKSTTASPQPQQMEMKAGDELYNNNNNIHNNNNHASNTNLNTTSNKKSTDNLKKKKNNNSNNSGSVSKKESKSTASLMTYSNLNLGKFANGSPKTEEETDSTTTESSNPDDVMMTVMMVRCDEEMREREKERTLSGKSGSSGSGNESFHNPSKSKHLSGKDSRKGSMKDSGIGTYLSTLDFKDFEQILSKTKSANKRDVNGSNASRGSVSPKDVSLWDTPRPDQGHSADGLSEFAAQTQMFVMNRSTGKQRVGVMDRQQQSSSIISGVQSPPPPPQQQHFNSGSSQTTTLNSSNTRNQQRKPAGVIGQHRMLSQMHSSTPTSVGINSLITTTLAMTMATTSTSSGNSSSSRHTPPVRTSSNPSQGWGTDGIMSDNGCDIWNRKNSLETGGGFPPNVRSPPVSSSRQDSSAFNNVTSSYFPHQNGFSSNPTSTQPNHPNHSQSPYVHQQQQQPHTFTSRHSPKGTTSSSNTNSDSSYLFPSTSGITNELLSNLWQLNTSYENQQLQNRINGNNNPSGGGFPVQHHQQQQPQQQPSTSTSQVQQHGYLQRMRSDPSRGYAAGNWNPPTYFTNMDNHVHGLNTNSLEKEPVADLTWPPVTSSSGVSSDGMYSSWTASSSPVSTSASSPVSSILTPGVTTGIHPNTQEIWENTSSSASKWPSYSSTQLQSGLPDSSSMAVGPVRSGTTGIRDSTSPLLSGVGSDLTFRSRMTDVVQSQREVEAGLGFNPFTSFTSNIWEQHQSDNPGSWSNAYRYSTPNNE